MERLFDEKFLKNVGALRLRRAPGGVAPGEGASGPAGARAGFDLQDARPYAPGDDPRTVDWNALARLDIPLVKRFKDSAPPEYVILLDRSASMGYWKSNIYFSQKDRLARKLAGALGAVVIASGGCARLANARPPRTARSVNEWLSIIENAEPGAAPVPDSSLLKRAAGKRQWVIVSDLYDVESIGKLLDSASARGERVVVVAVWSRADRVAPAEDTEIVDSETGEHRIFTKSDREAFITKRAHFEDAWREHCRRAGAAFLVADADAAFEDAWVALLRVG